MKQATELKQPAYRVGKWLPTDQKTLENWISTVITLAKKGKRRFHPVIIEFKELIENDAEIYMLFHMMFNQVPHKAPYDKTPTGKPQIRNYEELLIVLNYILTTAPEFNDTGLVGFPINAILDWPMGTIGGFAAFINPKVNAQLKRILNEWAKFLKSKESRYILNKSPRGWMNPKALEKWQPDLYVCNPDEEYGGFHSWDDFFTRQFKKGARPVADPGNQNIIVNACESAPYNIERNVKAESNFWVKGQPYSLRHIFNNHDNLDLFVGGTVYQAFLSAMNYHRWHSPVDGTIEDVKIIDGTYYSEILSQGFLNPHGPDPSAPNNSQGYLSEVATRALVFIRAKNPKIGLMCFVSIGMSEVSSNEVTVRPGEKVEKGQQLGMFHYGGSSHCLIFRPETKLEFDLHGQEPSLHSENIPINSKIATVL
ncbi:MAG: phosphatidylserine decarboxylase family protein [Bacteroidales bacterium]|nr:phosphatidylserine decarboxylase family protein [Bacteroidales bacterium]